MTRRISHTLALAAVLGSLSSLAGCSVAVSQKTAKADGGAWPAGTSPQEVGTRVANRFVASPHSNFGRPGPPSRITYPESCAWYGALTFAEVTRNAALRTELVRRFEPLFSDQKTMIPVPEHVDYTVFAAVPLELYVQTKDRRYLDLGKDMADKQWGEPFGTRATPEAWDYFKRGLSWQTRLWIDDMFMITAAQAGAYRATGDGKYVDHAAKEMVVYLDTLQKPNGLFYHAPDVPYFWGRGNGWMAAGMSELLRALPADHPDRPRIMKGYLGMMEALKTHQDATGMWHQLIDDPESWPETSSTGMFTFAFITGVNQGWLAEQIYGPLARRAWLALVGYLDGNGDIREVSQGTNAYDPKRDGPDGRQYYLARERITGDMHGQAPVLWSATAWLR